MKMESDDTYLSLLAVSRCNNPPTDEQEKAARERIEPLSQMVMSLAGTYGWYWD